MARARADLGLRFEELSRHLGALDVAALHHVQRFFESQAALARQRRGALVADEKRRREAAAAVGAIPPSPESAYGRRCLAEQQRRERNLEIMRLARRGWSNAMIGARVGLHETNVSKIIQAELRATRV